MRQFYLMMDKKVREDFDTYSEQILRYICDTFTLDVPPYSSFHNVRTLEPKIFITVNKLASKTWQEYLSDVMEQISKSEFVISIEVGTANGRYLQDIILEKYCELTGVQIHMLRIDENAWHRICNGELPRFGYSQLPDVDIYNDKSEDWKE